jgi:hypothetical protein
MIKIAYAIAAICCLSSCATIFTGTHDQIYFKSNVEGATVSKDGNTLCKTPCSVSMKRSLNSVSVEVAKDGYESKVVTLEKGFNAVSIINLFNIVFWGIDLATGSASKYDRKSYDIQLDPKKP